MSLKQVNADENRLENAASAEVSNPCVQINWRHGRLRGETHHSPHVLDQPRLNTWESTVLYAASGWLKSVDVSPPLSSAKRFGKVLISNLSVDRFTRHPWYQHIFISRLVFQKDYTIYSQMTIIHVDVQKAILHNSIETCFILSHWHLPLLLPPQSLSPTLKLLSRDMRVISHLV